MAKKETNYFMIISIALVVIIAAYFLYSLFFMPKSTSSNTDPTKINDLNQSLIQPKVTEYKKTWFNSVLCSYECPLMEVVVKNKTGSIPDKVCVEGCAKDFRQMKSTLKTNFTATEVSQDNLIKDMESVINRCRNESIIKKTGTINTTILFPCSANGLKDVKSNYTYLN